MKRTGANLIAKVTKDAKVSKSMYFNNNNKCKCRRLLASDYDKTCEDLAKYLLGKVLVRNTDEELIKGMIVETECYPGGEDRCSHSYNGKETERNKAMFMSPGTMYVYMTYGMYFCTNISSKGDGAAVLIRALQPIENVEYMETQRLKNKKNGSNSKPMKMKDLCNGPSKLCQALYITKDLNTEHLSCSSKIWVENLAKEQEKHQAEGSNFFITCKRIGLNNSKWKEWVDKPLRYYIYGNENVSVRNKEEETKQLVSLNATSSP